MKQNINIEAEGNELVLKNKAGDYVIIPKKYRLEVQDMIKENCHSCIDDLVETLPIMEDYAQDGSLYSEYLTPDPSTKKYPLDPNTDGSLPSYFKGSEEDPIELNKVTVTAEAPEWLKYRREYVKNNPVMEDYAEDGSLLPDWDKVKSVLNPKNWGVTDYTNKGDFKTAYSSARQAGEKEFMWNNKRYNTNYKGTPEQQLKETGITDKQRLESNIIRDRMENNIYDFSYYTKNPIVKMKNIILDNEKEVDLLNSEGKIPKHLKTHKDFLSLYLGKPQKYNTVSISKYKPSDSKEENKEYFSVNSEEFQNYILKHLDENYISRGINSGHIKTVIDENGELIPNRYIIRDIGTGLGEFTIDRGEDENGKYISYWDKWNLNPYKGIYSATNNSNIEDLSFGIGKPFDIYDRIYFEENLDSNKYAEYDKKIDDLWRKGIETQDNRYLAEARKLYPIRNSYYNKQNKYIKQYYSDKELSKLDINKKNFDTLALQRELSNRGYKLPKSTKKDGTFDGVWGDETRNALLEYRKSQNKSKR